MKTYAEVFQSKVWALHVVPDDHNPEFNPNSMRYLIDVTNVNPQPQQGWICNDPITKDFSPPANFPTAVRTGNKTLRARKRFKRGQMAKALQFLHSNK